MEYDSIYQQLRDEVEKVVGYKAKTPKDFDKLSDDIEKITHIKLSSYTLKRFWGYLKSVEVRRSTLDALCRMAGYTSWDGFCDIQRNNNDTQSHMSFSDTLNVALLDVGTRVRLSWNPGRCVIMRYEGHGLFVVEDSINSKLRFGDTFRCFRIVANEPLLLSDFKRPGMPVCSYVCGERDGVVYSILNEE
ncbi:MAG: hypothetical protein MJZ74_10945 [Muribaculaceae bacterium]|nr:hypothetical protein [Muribaculaceae bacterium]